MTSFLLTTLTEKSEMSSGGVPLLREVDLQLVGVDDEMVRRHIVHANDGRYL